METLTGMNKLGGFSAIWYKGDYFCNFMFDFLQTKSLLKRTTLKGKDFTTDYIVFLLKLTPFRRVAKRFLTDLYPLKVYYLYPLPPLLPPPSPHKHIYTLLDKYAPMNA